MYPVNLTRFVLDMYDASIKFKCSMLLKIDDEQKKDTLLYFGNLRCLKRI